MDRDIIELRIDTEIKPCPRPRHNKKTKSFYLPKHSQDALETEIFIRMFQAGHEPTKLKYDAVIVNFGHGRGDIDNRLKTLLDALAKVTGQNDCNIKKIVAEISNDKYNIVTLCKKGETK
jgi:Holliday junction resolvase RusA-like endonuclease